MFYQFCFMWMENPRSNMNPAGLLGGKMGAHFSLASWRFPHVRGDRYQKDTIDSALPLRGEGKKKREENQSNDATKVLQKHSNNCFERSDRIVEALCQVTDDSSFSQITESKKNLFKSLHSKLIWGKSLLWKWLWEEPISFPTWRRTQMLLRTRLSCPCAADDIHPL